MIFFQPGVGVALMEHKNISFWGLPLIFSRFFPGFGCFLEKTHTGRKGVPVSNSPHTGIISREVMEGE